MVDRLYGTTLKPMVRWVIFNTGLPFTTKRGQPAKRSIVKGWYNALFSPGGPHSFVQSVSADPKEY